MYDETGRERTLNMDCSADQVTEWENVHGGATGFEHEEEEKLSSSQEKEKIILLAYPRSGSSFTGTGVLER